jgi:ABC-type branched-subunit amino acid transport system substrate-binding protein
MNTDVLGRLLPLVVAISIGSAAFAAGTAPIRIGILVPTDGPAKASGEAVIEGIESAVQEWKQAHPASPFSELETRIIPSQLRWGAQTDALVKAVFEDGTLAIIGAENSRTAHLAAQVVTRLKGEVLLVSLADDPTLTEIGVPWILRFPADARVASKGSADVAGNTPSSLSSLRGAAHDAARAVLAAVSDCGPDITAMRSFLSSGTFAGLTGSFTFDANGNRIPAKLQAGR